MAHIGELILKAFPNAFPGIDYTVDMGKDGPELVEWNLPDPRPTLESLQIYEKEIELQKIYDARRENYPPIGDQLDAILKQLQAEPVKVPELEEVIVKWEDVKEMYPKPVEPVAEPIEPAPIVK